MALPLPKVVPDIAPGGGIVTAMGGINALNNAMAEAEYNRVKAKLAPYSIGAQAASQMAYANLLAPQMMAKVMNNENLLSGMSEDQKRAALQGLYRAGSGQGTGNAFLQMPGMQGIQEAFAPRNRFSFTDFLKNQFRKRISPEQQQVNALVAPTQPRAQDNPMSSMNVPNTQASIANNNAQEPLNENDPDIFKKAEMWQASPEGQAMIEKTGNINYLPEDPQYLNDWYEKQQQGQQKTLAEKSGEFAGVKEEGKELGKIRGDDIKEIGREQQSLRRSGTTIDRLIGIIQNPTFRSMRENIPFYQEKQLKVLKTLGTPEQKDLIGDFISTAQDYIASTVNSFNGRALQKEFDLANKMKVDENDNIYVAEGKLRSLKTLKEIAQKKNDIILQLMQKKHMNLGDAAAIADKSVNTKAIEKHVNELLASNPSEDDINYTAKLHNISPEEVKRRLKEKGRYRG